MYLKNICDGVGSQNGSNGTPLDPPLFWLDNIFKAGLYLKQPHNREGGGGVASLRVTIIGLLCTQRKLASTAALYGSPITLTEKGNGNLMFFSLHGKLRIGLHHKVQRL